VLPLPPLLVMRADLGLALPCPGLERRGGGRAALPSRAFVVEGKSPKAGQFGVGHVL
jgi:hypothetical protein